MSDIGNNNPISPIWPTKPVKRPGERKHPEKQYSEEDKKRQRERQKQNSAEDQPWIDDYA